MEKEDYYKLLDISPEADDKQIKEAYRRAAFQFHPDRNRDNPNAAEKMKMINEAYAVLSHPAKRSEYDALRTQFGSSAYDRFKKTHSEQDIFSGSDIQAVFEEMARTFGFRGFDEVFKQHAGAGYRSFEFKRPGFFAKGYVFTGSSGKGVGKSGSDGGALFPFQTHGVLGKVLRYAATKITGIELPQNGLDDTDDIYLSSEHARAGGPYAYFHDQKAKKFVVKIPPGIKEGQKIRLPGMGKPGKSTGRNGDLFLKVKFKKPIIRKLRDFIDDLRSS